MRRMAGRVLLCAFLLASALAVLAEDETSTTTTTENPATVKTTVTENPTTSGTSAPPKTDELDLYYVNDLRYNFYPLNSDGKICFEQADGEGCSGGISCLLSKLPKPQEKKQLLWLNAGNLLGVDHFRDLKFDPAKSAIKALKFAASSLDADLFRYDGKKAHEFFDTFKDGPEIISANVKWKDPKESPKSYVVLDNVIDACKVAVIGFTNSTRMTNYLTLSKDEFTVKDEIEGIKEAVKAIEAEVKDSKTVYIAIGEASSQLAKNIATTVDKIGIVLYSTYETLQDYKAEVVESNKMKKIIALLPPSQMPESLQIGQISINLDANCRVEGFSKTNNIPYNLTSSSCGEEGKQVIEEGTKILKELNTITAEKNKTSLIEYHTEACYNSECGIGVVFADGLRSRGMDVTAEAWNITPRASLIHNNAFATKAVLPYGSVTQLNVLRVLSEDSYLCLSNWTAGELKSVIEATVSVINEKTGEYHSFLQPSGIWIEYEMAAPSGSRVRRLWVQGSRLEMKVVNFADTTTRYSIHVPCSLLSDPSMSSLRANGKFKFDFSMSDSWLSEALSNSVSKSNVLIPPLIGGRIRMYYPVTYEKEDMTGYTVFYTLLVLVAIVTFAYQAYEFWRYRSVLTYVR